MSSSKVMVLKICLIGSWGVGKTSLRKQFMGDLRLKKNYMPTIGADFSLKSLDIGDESYQLLIWDIAGGEKFENVRDVYFQGAFGALLVFDLTRKDSFDDLISWVESIEGSTLSKGVPLILLGNKKDLAPTELNQDMSNKEIEELMTMLNERYKNQFTIHYFDTSIISGLNIDRSFITLISEIKKWLPIRKRRQNISQN